MTRKDLVAADGIEEATRSHTMATTSKENVVFLTKPTTHCHSDISSYMTMTLYSSLTAFPTHILSFVKT